MASITPNIYTYFGFGVNFGGLVSFMVGPLIFSGFKNSTNIYIGILGSLTTFFASLYLCTISLSHESKTLWATTLITLSGFFGCLVQGKGA